MLPKIGNVYLCALKTMLKFWNTFRQKRDRFCCFKFSLLRSVFALRQTWSLWKEIVASQNSLRQITHAPYFCYRRDGARGVQTRSLGLWLSTKFIGGCLWRFYGHCSGGDIIERTFSRNEERAENYSKIRTIFVGILSFASTNIEKLINFNLIAHI